MVAEAGMPSTIARPDIQSYEINNRALDFLSVKHAAPKGVYVTPCPGDATSWEGVLFARQGPFAPGVFRFRVEFPVRYPERPPNIVFSTDIFHPLISPLTTYTYSTQDNGTDTVSAFDEERLPPGGFSLRHGFPFWFETSRFPHEGVAPHQKSSAGAASKPPHILEVLYYLRNAITFEETLDHLTSQAVVNPNAWHAWRTHRAKHVPAGQDAPSQNSSGEVVGSVTISNQQPGGARKPGEWNWDGVWEDRVRKAVQASLSEQTLFRKSLNQDEMITFSTGPSRAVVQNAN